MKLSENKILHELKEHIPFAIFATLIAFILVAGWYSLSESTFLSYNVESFEIFHYAHIFFSSIVSAAIFYKYKNKFAQALVVGVFSTIIICMLSDIIFPYLGGLIMRFDMHFHLTVIEEPIPVFAIAIIGSLIGIKKKVTKIPHFFHVFLSTFASLFYLVVFGPIITLTSAIGIIVIVAFSVVIPCCLSDIVLPLTFVKR
ncbi:MAG: hypothetical protein JSW73_03550 [Candidatus Woesearchaeota archaeon]|nr:MAG: hypothetical protein JSW73_03550 [Candidatus Woesearchaeota archaeon]